MATWRKAPTIDPAEHARLQALIAASPEIRALRDEAGRRSMAAGRSVGWNEVSAKTRQILARQGVRLPDGYDVDLDGTLVYTNKTPWLQQLAWGAAPIAGVSAIGALAGPAAAGTAASAGSVAGGVLPSSAFPVAAAMTPTGVSAGGGMGGFFRTLGRFFGSHGGAAATNLAGNLLGTYMQGRSANRGYDVQDRYNREALDFLKSQDARDFAEYLKERDRDWRVEDEDRAHFYKREGEREGRLTPFRAGAERGYQTLSSLLYNPNQRMAMPRPVSGAVQRHRLADLLR